MSENGSAGSIVREQERPRVARGGGAATVQMVTAAAGARTMINGFTDIPPGAGIPLHFHDCEESVLVVSGRALVELDGVRHEAEAGCVTFVPSGVPHRFLNPSEAEPLRIFWTYASGSATRTLVETGETRPIATETE
ncbi:cupin domain-containing protein [Halovulum dunhuangense]|uniref:Cupin domain-containing protein n=1 Tax=Halovulum dunhuangense TaxID=1505036 RepID=A0A849L229_9RHOB|nr:cupin domain-containing protein [Halovulum dunhuangense]NNU80319.1 cupin domain-containing protein [Halovulum dunhuangense]